MSTAGLWGALIGLVVGILDYLILAHIIRRVIAAEVRKGTAIRGGDERVATLLRGVLLVNVVLFAGIGYWIGSGFFE